MSRCCRDCVKHCQISKMVQPVPKWSHSILEPLNPAIIRIENGGPKFHGRLYDMNTSRNDTK